MFKKRHKKNLLSLYMKETGEHLLDDLNFIKKHRRRRLIHRLQLIVFSILGLILFLLINVLIFYPSLKTAYTSGISAKNNLLQSSHALEQGQFKTAIDFANLADANWETSLKRINLFRFTPVAWLPGVRSYLNDVRYLLTAGQNLNHATLVILESGQDYLPLLFNSETKYSEITSENKAVILQSLYNSQNSLMKASASLQRSLASIKKIKHLELMDMYQINLDEITDNIVYTKNIIDKAIPLSQALPRLAGFPTPSNYLFILQNQDELRPTGGFIGTIGLGRLSNGDVVKLETHDVYHLDMPASSKMTTTPPDVLHKYLGVDKWYLRDANWSPDWPTSVKKILELYDIENNLLAEPYDWQDFDFVIGLTPETIIDLMEITGPIRIGDQVYWPENLVDLLQDSTGKDFGQLGYSRWDRKQVIGQITQIIQSKLMDSLSENWEDVFNVLANNLDQKNILIHSKSSELQNLFAKYGWTGEVEQTDNDYLMVIDANLAALKTDAVINRRIDYQVTENVNGLTAKVVINYANNGQFSWKTTRYRSYTRVYVPLGSKLIKASGYMSEDIDIGEELGKTYFGAFISIEPGGLANLSFEYELPETLHELTQLGKYDLTVQKQPGNEIKNLRVDLKFKNRIQLYNPAIFYSYLLEDKRVRWDTSLLSDRHFTVNF